MRPLVAAAFTLFLVGSASAQTASVPKDKVDAAQASWRKLSQSEVNCVDKALRARGSQIWDLIWRGMGPGDASVARVRASCRTEVKPPAARAAVQPKPTVQRATSTMAAADHATIAATGAEDTAEFTIPLNKTPVDRAIAIKTTPVKIAATAMSESKLAASEAVAEKASAETAVAVAQADAARAKAQADQARYEAERATADVIVTVASAQWRMGFVYGLVSGPAVLAVGGIVFLLLRRRQRALAVRDDVGEFDQAPALRQA